MAAVLLVFAMLPVLTMPASAENEGITVAVDGVSVVWTDAKPFIDENGRTMVPLRAVGDALGLDVDWDPSGIATFTSGVKQMYFPIGSTVAFTGDGETIPMDTAAVIVNNRTYAPVRYLAEYYGYVVGWNGETKTVVITSAVMSSEIETVHYEWDWLLWTWSYDLKIPVAAVDIYKSVERNPYASLTGYSLYVAEPSDDKYLEQLAQVFINSAEEKGFGKDAAVYMAVSFVQSLKYTPDDIGLGYDYPKYPLETLYDQGGDCEDTSILLVSLIREMGYGCSLIMFDNHMGVGILGNDTMTGSYFQKDSNKYFYVETTDEGWEIGEMPDELVYKTATVWPVL